MIWKRIGILSLLLLLPLLAKWVCDSKDYGKLLMFSQDEKIIEKKSYDEIFGTETVQQESKEGFWLGLLPAEDRVSFKAMLSVLPLSGILIFVSILSFYIYRKKKINSENK